MPTTLATQLLEATRKLFGREGIKGISVRRIAEIAGCTTMVVYTQFGGKDGILGALFDEGFERLAQAQSKVPYDTDPKERVVRLCQAFRETAHRFPHHYALMLGGRSGAFTPSPESTAKALSTLQTLVDAVTALRAQKKSRRSKRAEQASATLAAHALFSFCHGWVMLEEAGLVGVDPKRDTQYEIAISAIASISTMIEAS